LPHVVALYPVYYDGAKMGKDKYTPTGQHFKVFNDAHVSHNTSIVGDKMNNDGANKTFRPGESQEYTFAPQPEPMTIGCDFHKWMTASAWLFDHPYHAVTKGHGKNEKPDDFGKSRIERVPASVEVSVVAWRPDAGEQGYIWGAGGKKMTFKKGENKLDFSVK